MPSASFSQRNSRLIVLYSLFTFRLDSSQVLLCVCQPFRVCRGLSTQTCDVASFTPQRRVKTAPVAVNCTMFVRGGRPRLLKIGGSTGAAFMSSMRLSACSRSAAVGRLELGRKASAFEVVRCSEPRTLLRGPVSRASSAMGIELKVRTAVLSCDGGPPWLAQGV